MFGVNKLIENYDKFVFVSPHLDDAIFSCGQFIIDLKKRGKKVEIITVFTKGAKKTVSLQAKSFLRNCNYNSATKLFKDRKEEDVKALRFLKTKYIHLNFVDAAWRLNKKDIPVYSNEKIQFDGKISLDDKSYINKVKSKLEKIFLEDKRTLVIGPLGVGGHADHLIIRDILKGIFGPKLFWEDFPYNQNKYSLRTFFTSNKEFKSYFKLIRWSNKDKARVIKFYKSQLNSLFPSGKIPHFKENYYFVNNSKPF